MTTFQQAVPRHYQEIKKRTDELGFSMPSDYEAGRFLRTLAASKAKGQFLELGTGTGLSLSWILDGLSSQAKLITVDNDPTVLQVVREFYAMDSRISIVCEDGTAWVEANKALRFDFIFADTWAGKYNHLEEVLNMVNPGGFYLIDDMIPQDNWPEGHEAKAKNLITTLESRTDFYLSKLHWSSGIVVATKKVL